jgi:hypothetical protein
MPKNSVPCPAAWAAASRLREAKYPSSTYPAAHSPVPRTLYGRKPV